MAYIQTSYVPMKKYQDGTISIHNVTPETQITLRKGMIVTLKLPDQCVYVMNGPTLEPQMRTACSDCRPLKVLTCWNGVARVTGFTPSTEAAKSGVFETEWSIHERWVQNILYTPPVEAVPVYQAAPHTPSDGVLDTTRHCICGGTTTARHTHSTPNMTDQVKESPMSKPIKNILQIGDKVEVIGNTGKQHFANIGVIGTVTKTRDYNSYEVGFPETEVCPTYCQIIHSQDLKKVQPVAPVAPVVIQVIQVKPARIPSLSPQARTILRAMLDGHAVTRIGAMHNWSVQNVTARLTEMRNAGIEIKTTMKNDARGHRYGSYTLRPSEITRVAQAMKASKSLFGL